jgi:hypothetical protein
MEFEVASLISSVALKKFKGQYGVHSMRRALADLQERRWLL